ncbi:hypothetical protein T484DRAFT_1894978 [Baffinella frigidus]|nr:hypothetical protein T484DRAFT_1894978 [Cryptophyta sp. CCMP2293]
MNRKTKAAATPREEAMRALVAFAPQALLSRTLSEAAEYLRLATLLTPNRGSSELGAEAAHSAASLLALYADIAHARTGGALARHGLAQRGSVVPRSWAETGLEVARRVELLAEMFAERRVGEANKLPLLLVLEGIKALLKIRMSATGQDVEQKGKATGMMRASCFHLSHRARPLRLRWWLAGAILHALRPVVYLAALIICGQRSWSPFFLSLLMDIISQALATWLDSRTQRAAAARAAAAAASAPGAQASGEEAAEHAASGERAGAAAAPGPAGEGEGAEGGGGGRYLMRSPAFETFVRPLLEFLQRIARRIPLLGSIIGVVLDMVLSLGRYYFYTAAS